MLLVARKNLFAERTRLAISVGGVALAVFLISILLSLYRGWDERVGGFIEYSNVDVWIGTEGTSSFLAAASIVPTEGDQADSAAYTLDHNEAVAHWDAVIVRPVEGIILDGPGDPSVPEGKLKGKRVNLQVIGYNTASGIGGPIRIEEGKANPAAGEVIIDKALRKRYGSDFGDTIAAGGKDWKVVGISSGGDFVAVQTVFVDLTAAQDALGIKGLATFYALQLKPIQNLDHEKFASDLESLQPGIRVLTKAEFARLTRDQILGQILPILLMVLGLSFIVGLAVAGLTIYTATVEKAREYGILKAVGFKNWYLYRAVLEQSVVTGFLGFVIGVGITLVLGPFASDQVPQFVLYTKWQDIAGVAAVTVLMAAVAAFIPVRRLASIDPVAVFKA